MFYLGIVATTGNSLVVFVLVTDKNLRSKPNNILLINLACSDLGVSIIGYPFTTASAFAGRWLFGELGCILEGFSVTAFCLSTINTLLVMSVVRYILICKPQYRK